MLARVPQPSPFKTRLEDITIFSHRGEHDNRAVIENSLQAFENACKAGVGGIEFDVRWTKDLVPVVFHDPDLKRMFNYPRRVADFSAGELRREFPLIPSLDEVVAVFGRRMHLMIELKQEYFPDPEGQSRHLHDLLKRLGPGRDFHLISLTPQVFKVFDMFPSETYLPIARVKAGRLSVLSLDHLYGGLTGHYMFISRAMIDRHHLVSQKVGTGFVHSRNSLFREINRGVDWIFSNRAVWLQKIVDDLIGCDRLLRE